MVVGSTTAAITTHYFNPFVTYAFGAFLSLVLMTSSFFLTDEIETNEYALHLSYEDKLYLENR
jgi:hypothetical protein